MPTPRPPGAGSRGPVKRVPEARPSGYRVTDEVRRELVLAQSFTDRASLQGVIDLAVSELLAKLHKKAAFRAALKAHPPAPRER
jgi:hypothetical protein